MKVAYKSMLMVSPRIPVIFIYSIRTNTDSSLMKANGPNYQMKADTSNIITGSHQALATSCLSSFLEFGL
jgi:hypothetical protein